MRKVLTNRAFQLSASVLCLAVVWVVGGAPIWPAI
jgi:hypothetical protein